jgi:hypothetical protein
VTSLAKARLTRTPELTETAADVDGLSYHVRIKVVASACRGGSVARRALALLKEVRQRFQEAGLEEFRRGDFIRHEGMTSRG